MKTILIVIAVLIIGAGGYLYFMQPSTTPDTPTPTITDNENAAPGAKLNINVVCEGALAYMSFPDGAAADKFVADCKAGMHPEVIEKYKADLNLGAGAAI